MKKLVMFGAGIISNLILKNKLLQKDVEIVCYLDNSVKLIGKEFNGKIVKHPEEIKSIDYDYIIVTPQLLFKEIIDQLRTLGVDYEKIIINNELDDINFFNNLNCNTRNLIYKNNYFTKDIKDLYNLPIKYNPLDCTVITPINVELIHLLENDVTTHIFRTMYSNLFEYIAGHNDNYPIEFFEYYGINSEQEQHLYLIEKMSLFEQFDKLYLNTDVYFDAEYNFGNNSFTLTNKIDLALFLYYRGLRHINVKITMTEYEKFINKSGVQNLITSIDKNSEYTIYAPVLNPCFQNLSVLRDTSFYTRIDKIFKHLRGYQLNNKTVLDVGCSSAYNARMYSREGAIVTAVEIDEQTYNVAKAINELEYSKVNLLHMNFESISKDNKFDICILTTILYWYLDDEIILNNFLENVNTLINDMIIWESGTDPEREKDLITTKTKFKNYTYVGTTIGTNKVREIGVFTK